MNFVKHAIKTGLRSAGYELSATGTDDHEQDRLAQGRLRDNFLNLADAVASLAGLGPNDQRGPLLARQYGTPPLEALCILMALADTAQIAGDVCEFGCAQGETSALIANELLSGTKTFHVFDSFAGLPHPTAKDHLKDDIFALGSMDAYTGTMSCPEEMVRARLQAVGFPLSRQVIHKGFISQVFQEHANLPSAVSFAYVDFDFYEPIAQSLEYLHRVMPSGATVIVDDYDFFSTGAKTAVDEFLAAHPDGYEMDVPEKAYGYFAILRKM